MFSSRKRDNSVLYSQKTLATSDVYRIVKQYTSVFDSTTAQSFAAWYRNKKVDFLNAKEKKRKQVHSELSVLDESYYGKLN